jgi:hypothetical protein
MTKDTISAEKVLNSRCSSEDLGPMKSHFGTFTNKRPQQATIDHILNCLNIPRFSSGKLLSWFKDGHLVLGFQNSEDQYLQRLLHVESGMQHQAVSLAATAQGIGSCIVNQGIDGTPDKEKTATAQFVLMEMVDPYETGKYTTAAPGPGKPLIHGENLTDPLRDGYSECLEDLPNLAASKKSGPSAKEKDISQLLWAARGRTPHGIKTRKWKLMWGLTIPTWGGVQDYASVYLLRDEKLYKYINWTKSFSLMNRLFREKFKWTRGNPTHDIRFVRNLELSSHMSGHEEAIFLCQNEQTGRSIWEVGYMLENIFLQAKSLGISYESRIFSAAESSELNALGAPNVVASVFM